MSPADTCTAVKKGRPQNITEKERKYIFEECENNLLAPTSELVKRLAKTLDREENTIRAILWKEGYRPREEVRVTNLIRRIGRQVAKEEGYNVRPVKPSSEFTRILKKLLHQRLVRCLSERKDSLCITTQKKE